MTYSDNEYLRLFRKIIEWQWYTDVNTKTLFIHCLIRANWKPTKWKKYSLDAGQFIASYKTLAAETGLTYAQVRHAANNLCCSNEITRSPIAEGCIFTVVAYDTYQNQHSKNTEEKQQCDSTVTEARQRNKKLRSKEDKNKEKEKEKETERPDLQAMPLKDAIAWLEAHEDEEGGNDNGWYDL